LRHVQPDDQRRAARPRAGRPPPASSTCAASATATTIIIEPFRASAFPVVRIWSSTVRPSTASSQAGGYVSVSTGGAPDANLIPVPKAQADEAIDAAACIGCGACVAACKNASAALFTAAKIATWRTCPRDAPKPPCALKLW
jgi:succinate dehydrogenase / fumarate reductase, iron-sulfur subunit